MKTNHNKATPRVYHTLRQIVQRIPRWLIEKTANAHGVDARKFSATSHFVMLILGHLSRASCLTETCDDADLNKRKLSLVRIEAGRPHDSTVADELTRDMKGGDILLADRAYVDFAFLHNLTAREVFWILRQKVNMLYEVVESREVSGNVISDEIVRLTAANTSAKYPETLRRVRAIVEINGEKREMVFLTNNAQWAASTICELYKARWEIEVFFKEIKQTLRLTDFIGTNENAVKWQIWTGLLTHLLLHCLKFLSGWDKAFSRLAGIVRSAAWMDLDIVETLRLYWDGITPAPTETALHPAVFGGLLTTRI